MHVIFVIIFAVAGISIVGNSYRELRLLANYSDSIVRITSCKKEHIHQKTGPDPWQQIDYFAFELGTDALSYPIVLREGAEIGFWDALRFREPKPSKDWCQMVGRAMPVLHYDKVEVVVPYSGERPGGLKLLNHVFGLDGLILLGGMLLFVIGLAVAGFAYLIHAISRLKFRVERGEAESTIIFVIRSLQHSVSLFAIFIIALAFTVGLEWAFLKGMLYVENSNNLLTGVSVLIVLTIACFGPSLVLQGVYQLRTSKAPIILFIRDVLFVVALGPPTYGIWQFVISGDTGSATIWDLTKEIAIAAFS